MKVIAIGVSIRMRHAKTSHCIVGSPEAIEKRGYGKFGISNGKSACRK